MSAKKILLTIILSIFIILCSNSKVQAAISLDGIENFPSSYQSYLRELAKKQAEQILNDAQSEAKKAVTEIEQEITLKTKELEDLQKQFDVYKAKMESLLISQLELLKETNKD